MRRPRHVAGDGEGVRGGARRAAVRRRPVAELVACARRRRYRARRPPREHALSPAAAGKERIAIADGIAGDGHAVPLVGVEIRIVRPRIVRGRRHARGIERAYGPGIPVESDGPASAVVRVVHVAELEARILRGQQAVQVLVGPVVAVSDARPVLACGPVGADAVPAPLQLREVGGACEVDVKPRQLAVAGAAGEPVRSLDLIRAVPDDRVGAAAAPPGGCYRPAHV